MKAHVNQECRLQSYLGVGFVTACWSTLWSAICALVLTGATTAATNYSGTWDVTPCVAYTCGRAGFPPSKQINFCSLSFVDEYPTINVELSGNYPDFQVGAFASPTTFSFFISDSIGSCELSYFFFGEFVTPTTFAATMTLTCFGSVCPIISTCADQSWEFTGV